MSDPLKCFRPLLLWCFMLFFLGVDGMAQTTRVDALLKELKPNLSDTTRLRVYRQLAGAYASVDQEKKYYYAVRYKKIAERLEIDTLVVEAYIDMGGSHAIRSTMDSAFYYFTKAYQSSKEIGYQRGMARSLVNLGYVYEKIDKEQEAIGKYKEALALCQKINYTKGINQCYINIGGIYHELKEYEMAQAYALLAYESYKKIGFEPGVANALYSIATTHVELDHLDKAKYYFTESLKIREKLGDLSGIALCRWGLARLDILNQEYEKALPNLEIALKYDTQLKNTFHATAVLVSFSKAYIGMKDYKKAREYADKAFKNSIIMKSMGMRSTVVWLYMKIEEAQENYKEAYHYQNYYTAINDSIQKEEKLKHLIVTEFQRVNSENEGLLKSNKIIATKNTSYEKMIMATTIILVFVFVLLMLYYKRNKEKQATNILLKKQKDEISGINKELEMLNEELRIQMEITAAQNAELGKLNMIKNKFFSIVAHDLRSPLSNLKMLFELYREGQLNREELDDLLQKLEANIFTTADFLDNLLEWSKSQLDGMVVKPDGFEIGKLFTENINFMLAQLSQKEIQVTIRQQDAVYVYADRHMINVAIRNLISNCIKFCGQQGSIILDADYQEDKVLITIADTGLGIKKEDQEKIFQLEHTFSKGTSGEKGHHIGLVLCKDMVEQNHGRIWFESEPGVGTTFWIELPCKTPKNQDIAV